MKLRRAVGLFVGPLMAMVSAVPVQAQTPAPPPPAADDEWSGFNSGPKPATTPPAAGPAPTPTATQPKPKPNPAAQPLPTAPSPAPTTAPAATAAPTAAPLPPATTPAPTTAAPMAPTTAAPLPTTAAPAPAPTKLNGSKDDAAAKKAEPKLVSSKETVTEDPATAHSPATLGLALEDKRNERDAAAVNGQVGLLHMASAHFGQANVLRLSLLGEYFKSSNFPVQGASNTRSAGTFAISYTFLDWLQAYASYSVVANTNSKSAPRLIQDLGDTVVGLSAGSEVTDGLSVGLELAALIFPGVGNQDLSRTQFGFAPRGMLTYDVRSAAPEVPLRLHANLGFILDRTKYLADGHTLTAPEEFALAINRFNRFTIGVGVEAPLPVVTPFVEYDLHVPLGTGTLISPDNTTVGVAATMHQSLGLGARVTALKDVTLQVALDIGLARTVAYGIPGTMPWNLLFGASYAVDPLATATTRTVEKLYERPVEVPKPVEVAPTTGRIEGVAIDSATRKPIAGALVTVANDVAMSPVATDAAKGHFVTYELPVEVARLVVEREGYYPGSVDVTVVAGKTVPVEVPLVKQVQGATLKVALTSKGQPVTGTVAITGDNAATLPAAGVGTTQLPAGHYVLSVAAEGYAVPTPQEAELKGGEEKTIAFELTALKTAVVVAPKPEPAAPKLVVIIKNKIVIKQQVHFATDKSTILPDSFTLLNQVASAILSNNLKAVLVEGHTDNVGPKDHNQTLSQERAESVKAYLIKRGIAASALDAKGFGDTKPIAPNLTAKGREQNRRVEFTITGK
jgi:outer membrane protein OmpA-like peptidoglycan-associated protein